jgi:hypothetical protein
MIYIILLLRKSVYIIGFVNRRLVNAFSTRSWVTHTHILYRRSAKYIYVYIHTYTNISRPYYFENRQPVAEYRSRSLPRSYI